jgi:hypothetical protein
MLAAAKIVSACCIAGDILKEIMLKEKGVLNNTSEVGKSQPM